MKKFLRKLILFSLFPIVYISLNWITNLYIYSSVNVELENKRVLIVGDSYSEKSINPNMLGSAQNISQAAEPYVITFWKIKEIFDVTIPDTVLIGFAPHNISAFNDLKFSRKKIASELFKRCYTIENLKSIDEKIDINYQVYYTTLFKQLGFYPRHNHIFFIGNYSNIEQSDISDWNEAIERHYYLGENEIGISEISIDYLDSILYLCKTKEVLPILIGSPVHKSYYRNIPVVNMNVYNKLKEKYELEGVNIIDKSNVSYPDSLFLNSDHLNSIGAEVFTNELKNVFYQFR